MTKLQFNYYPIGLISLLLLSVTCIHAQPSTGYALSMDGNFSEIQVPALHLDNSAADGVTIEMWIKPGGTQQQNDGLWMFRSNDESDVGIDAGLQFRTGAMRLGWPAVNRITPAVVPANDTWTHVAFVLGRTEKSLYFNGVLQGSNTYSETEPYTFNTITGIANDNVASLNRSFTGLIDDVRLWQEARTAQEIVDHMDGFTDDTNLILHYTFDDQADGVATDMTGTAHGTITGGSYLANTPSDVATLANITSDVGVLDPRFKSEITSYSVLVPQGTSCINLTAVTSHSGATVSGDGVITLKNGATTAYIQATAQDGTTQITYEVNISESETAINYALYLPGGNGNVSHVDLSGLDLTSLPYTIEMWIKPETIQNTNAGLLFNRPGNYGLQYTSDWQTTSQSLRHMTSGGQQYGEGTETTDVPQKQWHHVAVVMTDSSRTVYLDGVSRTESSTFTADDFSTGNTYLGWDTDGTNRAFNGWMDEVRVWNVARTAEELEVTKYDILDASHYSQLTAYWNFDDVNANDVSGNGQHGTINGGTITTSSVFDPMAYLSANVYQTDQVIRDGSEDNVVAHLEINTENNRNPLRLSSLLLSTTGTTDPSEISNVKIYYTGADDVFNTRAFLTELGGSPTSATYQLTMNDVLNQGPNHFWVTYDIADGVSNGTTFDLVCDGFFLANEEGTTNYAPSTTAPEGALTVRSDLFIDYVELAEDTVTIASHSAFEGANFASFQQNAIMTFNGYQYVTYWTDDEKVAIGRKKLPSGNWEELRLDYERTNGIPLSDNHQTISMGICANDGTIHIAYDHHDVPLQYQKSVSGLATNPEDHLWEGSSFGAMQDYLEGEGTQVTPVTYPRFISKPNGDLLYECRLGQSGNGDSYLWEYSGTTEEWVSLGKYIEGSTVSQNAYINGMHYDATGRLHVSWIWRETPDPQTNHDVYYAYSEDDGRTWLNSDGSAAGTTGTSPMELTTASIQVWTVNKNRGLINQEAQVADTNGGIHILQSYMSNDHANSTNFWQYRIDHADLRHIYQDANGNWHSDIIAPSARNRSDIAIDQYDNLYVVSGDHRVYFAAASDQWQTWTALDISKTGLSQNEGFIDRERLLNEHVLSYLYTSADNDGKILITNYQLASRTASLAEIQINGVSVPDFSPDTYTYTIELAAGTSLATIDAIPYDVLATVDTSTPTTLPGTASILVTAGHGEESNTYTIRITSPQTSNVLRTVQQLKVYPTSFTSSGFKIESTKEISGIQLVDLRGKLIKSLENVNKKSLTIDGTMDSKGLLLLNITHSDGSQSALKLLPEK